MNKVIGIINGSFRKNSFSQSVSDYVAANAPDGLVFKVIDISNLPLYNQDYDEANPVEYTVFRDQVRALDGVLFITPEHNRSIPAALKNALDVGSRPYGESVWNGKPGAIISLSPGNIGGFGATHHLRQILAFLNVQTMAQPEAYLSAYHTLIDENGALSNESTKGFINSVLAAFKAWVDKVS